MKRVNMIVIDCQSAVEVLQCFVNPIEADQCQAEIVEDIGPCGSSATAAA